MCPSQDTAPASHQAVIVAFLDKALRRVAAARCAPDGPLRLPGGDIPAEAADPVASALQAASACGWAWQSCTIDPQPFRVEHEGTRTILAFVVRAGKPAADYECASGLSPCAADIAELAGSPFAAIVAQAREYLQRLLLDEFLALEVLPINRSVLKQQTKFFGLEYRKDLTLHKLETVAENQIHRLRCIFFPFDTALVAVGRIDMPDPADDPSYGKRSPGADSLLRTLIAQRARKLISDYAEWPDERQQAFVEQEFLRLRAVRAASDWQHVQLSRWRHWCSLGGYTVLPIIGAWHRLVDGRPILRAATSLFIIDHNRKRSLRDDIARGTEVAEPSAATVYQEGRPAASGDAASAAQSATAPAPQWLAGGESAALLRHFARAVYGEACPDPPSSAAPAAAGDERPLDFRVVHVDTFAVDCYILDDIKRRVIQRWAENYQRRKAAEQAQRQEQAQPQQEPAPPP
ncbi:MAG: hypothetical protein RMM29_04805 [Planctomycetota bacterium]|nr:hypothetical protein [Planctomycetota bacterium]MCX8039977.1 hypothetical protein [Planctomycetota bacterium]MDW8372955.1 hypothetical protein [Planctomycetota bacterium]